jgi:hypothetical protein
LPQRLHAHPVLTKQRLREHTLDGERGPENGGAAIGLREVLA